jgi:signal transduction histidine kinase
LSFIKSDQIRFRYKLEGLDENWVDAGTRRTVNYSYLPNGEYFFKVIAANSDGVWNTEGKTLKIIVLAPFYKTWWFIFGVILLTIFTAYLLYRYRIRQLKKLNAAQESFSRQLIESQEAERKRIAQELHDGLGQNLLVIKNRAVLGLNAKGNEKTDEQFGEIQESVSDALIEVRSIAYNLRPLHIERLGLTSTIEEMIEEISETSGININYDIEPIDDIFSTENEINFYRIVQESLNNIVKHSKAERANVEVFRENYKLNLKIRDDGLGFEVDNVKQGLGLNGMAERAKILGGTYSIETEVGKGTTVLVEISEKK